jgi:hypothetical protein
VIFWIKIIVLSEFHYNEISKAFLSYTTPVRYILYYQGIFSDQYFIIFTEMIQDKQTAYNLNVANACLKQVWYNETFKLIWYAVIIFCLQSVMWNLTDKAILWIRLHHRWLPFKITGVTMPQFTFCYNTFLWKMSSCSSNLGANTCALYIIPFQSQTLSGTFYRQHS